MEVSVSLKRRRSSDDDPAPIAPKRPTPVPEYQATEHATVAETARALDPVHIEPEELRAHIQEAVDNALSSQVKRYTALRCLLVSWEDDNIGCIDEVNELKDLLDHKFGFQCHSFQIPSQESERRLRHQMTSIDATIERTDLFVMYYGGHSYKSDNDDFIWTSTLEQNAASLNWTKLQDIVEQMPCDALLILDSCYSAHVARALMPGKKEVLAASGWDATAVTGVQSRLSFTAFLIDELNHFAGSSQCFTIGELFSRLIRKKNRPDGRILARTPFYCQLPCQEPRRSILLCPQSATSSSTTPKPISETLHSPIQPYPRMIVAVSFKDGFESRTAESIREWLTSSIPPEVSNISISVEFAARSNSTVTILTMPVTLWMALSNHPAVRPCGLIFSAGECSRFKAVARCVVTIQRFIRRWTTTRESSSRDLDTHAVDTHAVNTEKTFEDFHNACIANDISAVTQMISDGVDPDILDTYGRTGLYHAASRGYWLMSKLLLDKGADINAQGGENGNALQAAASNGSVETVQLLLEKGADVDAQGGRDGNALKAAASRGFKEIVQLLLDKGTPTRGAQNGNTL